MAMDEHLKGKLEASLLNHEAVIRIPTHNVRGLLQAVIDDNPKITVYLENIEYEIHLAESVMRVKYCNKDIPITDISQAGDYDGLEEILHKAIGKFNKQKIVIVPSAFDISSSYASFLTKYQGYYSNLISIECATKSFSLFGNWKNAVFQFQYRIGRVKLSMMENAVNGKIAEVTAKLFLPEMSPEVKAYIAHNYLARTVTYWKKAEPNPLERSYMQSAYGALINGKCVCQGYAEAYKRILDSLGIQCEIICGKIRGSAEHHAWNIVSFDGKEFYHVDVTWDSDGNGKKSNTYFCKSDADLTAKRIWTRGAGMICSGKRNILQDVKLQIARNKSQYVKKGIEKLYLE